MPPLGYVPATVAAAAAGEKANGFYWLSLAFIGFFIGVIGFRPPLHPGRVHLVNHRHVSARYRQKSSEHRLLSSRVTTRGRKRFGRGAILRGLRSIG
jgi:hypothetical protein